MSDTVDLGTASIKCPKCCEANLFVKTRWNAELHDKRVVCKNCGFETCDSEEVNRIIKSQISKFTKEAANLVMSRIKKRFRNFE